MLNLKKCHFLTLGNGSNLCNFSCDDITTKKSVSKKTLGLIIGSNLDFGDHVSNIWKTANQKLNALFRVSANVKLRQMHPVNSYFY